MFPNGAYGGGVQYSGIQYLPLFWTVFRYFDYKMVGIRYFSHNGYGKIQFLVENTTVTLIIQKYDYGTRKN